MNRTLSIWPRVAVCIAALTAATQLTHTAQAVTVPFVEDFNTDSANWGNFEAANSNPSIPGFQTGGPASWVSSGGPDGSGYASVDFAFGDFTSPFGGPTLFRGQDEFNSSNGDYIGDWLTNGIRTVRYSVRHNAPVPIPLGVRVSTPFNFPGASAVIQGPPVPPNIWTELVFDLSPGSPQIVSTSGQPYNSIFANVGHIQITSSIPTALIGDPTVYTFDLDNVTAVPEPAAVSMLTLAAVLGLGRRRIRN